MKRKFALLIFITLSIFSLKAQNIQQHYDFGRSIYSNELSSRATLTTTLEMFKTDSWGSTYFFVDMDSHCEGISFTYWELERELKFWEGPMSIHLEYNGGTIPYINHAFMSGATYTYNNNDFSNGFSLSAMYVYNYKCENQHNVKISGTWYINFAKDRLTFDGFFDLWNYGAIKFLSEPQFWVNLNKFDGVNNNFNLSLGGEVELSYNFAINERLAVIPTLAAKWTF
ncbi:MAG: DUF5020 family protein [Bacteroidales bacterium]|nr:DUF5020 family protein [Bacteroidales bacterium]